MEYRNMERGASGLFPDRTCKACQMKIRPRSKIMVPPMGLIISINAGIKVMGTSKRVYMRISRLVSVLPETTGIIGTPALS